MGGSVAILGSGAIGSYVGAMLSLAGEEVVLIDGWPAHVEAVRKDGLRIEGPDGVHEARPAILHLGEAQQLRLTPPRLVILSVKLYDTEWAATMARDMLKPGAPLLTVQNSLVEETVARIVGWPRVLGGIATGMNVELAGPRLVRRGTTRFRSAPVFKIGELHGRLTPRVQAIVELMSKVDTAVGTTNLWNDRWLKLCINSMVSAIGGIANLPLDEVHRLPEARAVGIRLGAEACAVGEALGFDPGPVFAVAPGRWIAAGAGDAAAARDVERAFVAQADKAEAGYRSGTLQDLLRGRRTEVDYFNGYIADRGKEVGVAAPTHDSVARMVREIEAGHRSPAMRNLKDLLP